MCHEHGSWLCGYGANSRVAITPMTELRAGCFVLDIAWDRGFLHVHAQIDSQLAIRMIENAMGTLHHLFSMVTL